jgi:hypothetical protein
MGNFTVAAMFVILVNVLMWLIQLSMLSINPLATSYYDIKGSVIESSVMKANMNQTAINNDVLNSLPESSEGITTGSSNIFIDSFQSIITWIKNRPGVKYAYGVVAAPYNILKNLNLPDEVAIALGTLWYMVSLIVLVAWLRGFDS